MDDNIRVYYYNGEWQQYDYLHITYGITLEPSTPITVYDDELNGYSAWIDTTDERHPIWVVRDSQWYFPEELPYWIKLDTKYNVYLIGQLLQLDTYTRASSEMYDYNGGLKSYLYMHNNFGITKTPSTVYYVKNNIIKCWYNPTPDPELPNDKYWDVDTIQWYDRAPEYGGDTGDINAVGATGLFLYYSETGLATSYGTVVDGHCLQPMCLNMPISGDMSCQRHDIELTGSWRILTETSRTSAIKPCIVFATKISDIAPDESDSVSPSVIPLQNTGSQTSDTPQNEGSVSQPQNNSQPVSQSPISPTSTDMFDL